MSKLVTIFFLLVLAFSADGQQPETVDLEELQTRISRLLEVDNIPAIGLALIDKDGNRLVRSFGYANVVGEIPATENSIYRLGSISKMFAALAILKLRDEGKLKLSDRLQDLAPDVEFTNPWEEEYPVRVQHLLNHTTGWDDYHGTEWMTNDSKPLTTKEGVDLHPHTRVSRWPPGTRMAYSNTGAPVAAYIVETISGKSYEEFIRVEFFKPMGLSTTSFLYSEAFQKLGVTNYRDGQPLDYYHISGRAAGALNSSPLELLKILDLFINRGVVDSVRIIDQQSILDMENGYPEFGLVSGYALGNFTSNYKGFVFRGHNGAIDNALATLYYLPEHKIGYALMTSSITGKKFRQLNELVTNYLIQNLNVSMAEQQADASLHNPEIEGYYYLANPRNHKFRIIQDLFEPAKVEWRNDTLYFGPAFGKAKKKFVAVEKNTYAEVEGNHRVHLMTDYDESKILHQAVFGGTHSFKPISGLMVYNRVAVFLLALLLSLITIIIAIVQGVRLMVGSLKISKDTSLAIGPGLSSLLFLPLIVLFLYLMNHPFDYLFTRNGLTMTLFLLSLVYGLSTVWSILHLGRHWQRVKGDAMNIYLAVVSVVNFLMAAYLLSQGMIGIQTWA